MKKDRFEIFSASVLHLVKSVQVLKAQKMAEYGLKGTTAAALCRVLESENGLTPTELCVACEIDKAQVSRSVAELVEKGFLVRDAIDAHRYKQKYRLTAAGRRAAIDVSRAIREIEEAVSRGISPIELDRFYHTLYCLCDNFEALLRKNQM